MMGWGIVPQHIQGFGVVLTSAWGGLQEGGGGLGVAVSLKFHNLHLTGLQAYRRVVAGFFAPLGLVGSTNAGSP
jgi:hypothetical protein